MIVLTDTTTQTIASGSAVTYDTVALKTGCAERHRTGTGAVRLTSQGLYEIHVNANVTGDTEDVTVSLSVQLDGSSLPETVMDYTPPTADASGHVSTTTIVKIFCGDTGSVSVVNTGSVDIIVENPCLVVKRIA